MNPIKLIVTAVFAVCLSSGLSAQKLLPVIVNADKPEAEIKPTMWGIFFEDINFAADGGIYAELVKNRSFEFYKPKMGWKIPVTGTDSSHFIIMNRGALNENNPRYARITLKEGMKPLSITNNGFRGMGIKQNNRYNFSVMASLPVNDNIKLTIELLSEKGEKIGETVVTPKGKEWKKYEASFTASKTDLKSSLRIIVRRNGNN